MKTIKITYEGLEDDSPLLQAIFDNIPGDAKVFLSGEIFTINSVITMGGVTLSGCKVIDEEKL